MKMQAQPLLLSS